MLFPCFIHLFFKWSSDIITGYFPGKGLCFIFRTATSLVLFIQHHLYWKIFTVSRMRLVFLPPPLLLASYNYSFSLYWTFLCIYWQKKVNFIATESQEKFIFVKMKQRISCMDDWLTTLLKTWEIIWYSGRNLLPDAVLLSLAILLLQQKQETRGKK